MKFSELQLNDQVLDALEAMRFESAHLYKRNPSPLYLKAEI